MKAIAQRQGESVFIVETEPGKGRIVDVNRRTMSSVKVIASLAKWGGWVPVTDAEQAAAAESLVSEDAGRANVNSPVV